MSIGIEEQETVISYNRVDDYMNIYTSDKTQMTKLDKKVKEHPEVWSVIEIMKDTKGEIVGKSYQAPKKLCSLRNNLVTHVSNPKGNPNAVEALKKWRENKKKD